MSFIFSSSNSKNNKEKNVNIEKGLVQNFFQGRSNNIDVEYRIEIVAKRKQFP